MVLTAERVAGSGRRVESAGDSEPFEGDLDMPKNAQTGGHARKLRVIQEFEASAYCGN
jgi:hypothetical protein